MPEDKIDLIPHGIPDMPFVDPNFFKDQFDVEGKFVALTFGLLSPNKGIENVLQAMPKIIAQSPDFVYIVLGATHPNLVREQGETYRLSLERLAQRPGYQEARHLLQSIRRAARADRVHRRGRHLHHAVLERGASGVGHAGLLVRLRQGGDLDAVLARRGTAGRRPRRFGAVRRLRRASPARSSICGRTSHERNAMRKRAYLLGREMIWSHVAHLYMESFQRARHSRPPALAKTRAVRTLDEEPPQLARDAARPSAGR